MRTDLRISVKNLHRSKTATRGLLTGGPANRPGNLSPGLSLRVPGAPRRAAGNEQLVRCQQSDGAGQQHHFTAARLRRLALEIVGPEGDSSPLMLKNLPPVCRRLRQKISWTDPNSMPAMEYCSKNAGRERRGRGDPSPASQASRWFCHRGDQRRLSGYIVHNFY